MKIDFIELTNFRNIQKQKINFKDKNLSCSTVTMEAERQRY